MSKLHQAWHTARRVVWIAGLALLLAAPTLAARRAQEADPTPAPASQTPPPGFTPSPPTPETATPPGDTPITPAETAPPTASATATVPATATATTPATATLEPSTPTPAPPSETPTAAISPTLAAPGFTPTPLASQPPLTTTLPLTLTTQITQPTFSPYTYLPLIFKFPPYEPTQGVLMCAPLAATIAIPDNQPAGVNSSMWLADDRIIADLDIRLTIDHTWVGDLSATLRHQESGLSASLFDRPNYPSTQYGCEYDHVRAIFNDEMDLPAERICAASPAGLPGSYEPITPLETFTGKSIQGTWTLNVADNYQNDAGRITSWCLWAQLSPNPEPTPTPPAPPSLPSQVILSGITGKPQALPLDCETRSAVDWARYFGVSINELTFFNQLPHSDNPDKGFVGNVYGDWGNIPPDDYGVHAEPIAALLRNYGLSAYAHRPLGWDWLRAEIAARRPVIVWITGNVEYGIPVFYTPASDGLTTLVARYEHTVVVTGYSSSSVYYLNGSTIYTRSINQFLASWSTMGYMAVAATP